MDQFGWMDEEDLAAARRDLCNTTTNEQGYSAGFGYSIPSETFEDYPSNAIAWSASSLGLLMPNTTAPGNNDPLGSNYSTNFLPGGFPMLEEPRVENNQAPLIGQEQSQPQHHVDYLRFHKCALCNQEFENRSDLYYHQKDHEHTCFECGESFSSHSYLDFHAYDTHHESYRCNECDARFSRLDVLKRHKLRHSPTTKKYSCKHCKKWRAPNGFTRKDHLIQHERNYHHIESTDDPNFFGCCPHEGCALFRPSTANGTYDYELIKNPLFPSRGAFTKHMRQEHDEAPFPCTKAGCKRVNGKGFFRKRDLIKHMKREHEVSEEAESTLVGEDVLGDGSFASQ